MKNSSFDLADYLYDECKLRFISGKFFVKNEEIKNIDKYCTAIPTIRQCTKNLNELQSVIDSFIAIYGDKEGTWPEMPIIEEARRLTELKPMAFPLNEKQLLLINRILYGQDEYMYILTGVACSGKSTFGNIVKQIFGNDVSSLNLRDLSDDFKRATGIGKRLVYADELNSDELDNGSIKTIVSKQMINVNGKNKQPYDARWQGTLFFSCNKPPRLDLSDSGIVRRICYYSMNTKIDNPDTSLQKRQYTHEELVNIVAHALRVDTTNWFDNFKYETRELLRCNNSVWICKVESGIKNTTYSQYVFNAELKGLRKMSEPRFQEIKDLLIEWEEEEDNDLPF